MTERKPLTMDEAWPLVNRSPDKKPDVTIYRSGATWTGKVSGIISRPAVVIQTPNGQQVVVIEGAEFEVHNA